MIVVSIIINLIYEYAFYFRTEFYNLRLRNWLYINAQQFIELQASRNRFFIEIYDYALLPIIIYFLKISRTPLKKLGYLLLTVAVCMCAVLSNYRIQVIVAVLAVFGSLKFVIGRSDIFLKKMLFFCIAISVFIAISISNQFHMINVFDRFGIENQTTIISRIEMWYQAIKIGKVSPLTGVGLGNYYDWLENKQTNINSTTDPKNQLMKVTAINAHNIFFSLFSETGLLGLVTYIAILIHLLRLDFKNLQVQSVKGSLIFSFWLLVIISLVGPTFDIQYLTLFWIIRGLIANTNHSIAV
jgi:O-antigen ligase